jgi:GLPGLI family protein
MKKTLLIAAVTLACINGRTQTSSPVTSGIITYEEKMKLEIKLEGESSQFSEMLPKERTEKKTLWFSPDASLYKMAESSENEEIMEQEGGTMVMRIVSDDDIIYRDLVSNTQIEQREFMSRTFLIQDDGGKTDWKLTGEQKTILGYPCQEATREEDGRKIKAWFTPAIPVSTGPGNYGNLPGLILAIDVNDGQRTITASSVRPGEVDRSKLVKPKEGKKVTAQEFKKIVDEKMKEMGGEGGGGQQIMIKITK